MKNKQLEIIVFICGAVVMILELVGSRVLAPYMGTSIFVWTSLIGIIMGSLSVGYWWGGKIADHNPTYKRLSLIILLSALVVALLGLIKEPVLEIIRAIQDVRVGSIVAAIVLFSPASILLGMVSPYAVKLKMQTLETTGATVGRLYAISTIGSIVGTFLAGFYLIARFGNTTLIYILAGTLVAVSVLAYASGYKKFRIAILVIILLGIGVHVVMLQTMADRQFYDIDTQYSRVWIFNRPDPDTGRDTRYLSTNPTEIQSASFIEQPNELVFDYTKYYHLGHHFNPQIKKALLVGGGAYSFPKNFLQQYPEATIDVVEIDPDFTRLAKQYFGLKDDPRLKIFHEDGRTFLNRTSEQYDVIYMDAFRSSYSIPHHLTTREVVEKMHSLLSENGVLLTNVISAAEGYQSQFLRAEYHTYTEVFPQVEVFLVNNPKQFFQVQNVMMVALKSDQTPIFSSEQAELNEYLSHRLPFTLKKDLPVLTDDYSPVDQYMMPLM